MSVTSRWGSMMLLNILHHQESHPKPGVTQFMTGMLTMLFLGDSQSPGLKGSPSSAFQVAVWTLITPSHNSLLTLSKGTAVLPLEVWVTDPSRYLTQTGKCMKGWDTWYDTGEPRVRATTRHHCVPMKVVQTYNADAAKTGSNTKFSLIAGGKNKMVQLWRTGWCFPRNLNIVLLNNPTITLHRFYSKEWKTYISTKPPHKFL